MSDIRDQLLSTIKPMVEGGDPAYHVSTMFAAILGYILDVEWTEPTITSLVIANDGELWASKSNNPMLRHIGESLDLWTNLDNLSIAAGLSTDEHIALARLAHDKVIVEPNRRIN